MNGLRTALTTARRRVVLQHLVFDRGDAFDHAFRIKTLADDESLPSKQIDVYEFCWAPLTQGHASFTDTVRWLAVTGFTPLRRFAFNIPLLLRRTVGPAGDQDHSRLLAFLRDVWRLIYVAFLAWALAVAALALVSKSTALLKHLPDTLILPLHRLSTGSGLITTAIALMAAISAVALGWSLPEQLRDFLRLRKLDLVGEVDRAVPTGHHHETKSQAFWRALSRLLNYRLLALKWEHEQVTRLIVLGLSVVGVLFSTLLLVWLCWIPECIAIACPPRSLHEVLSEILTQDALFVVAIVAIAVAMKRVFIDYLADVALYTTPDENSAFFTTRAAILQQATSRIRSLLRDTQYQSIGIAGHSLGSVIGYDAINWLRTEARLPSGGGVRGTLEAVSKVVQKLIPGEPEATQDLIHRFEDAAEARLAPVAVTKADLEKLKLFVTFGSPLNKVLYFFQTRLKSYETVRGHILQEPRWIPAAPRPD